MMLLACLILWSANLTASTGTDNHANLYRRSLPQKKKKLHHPKNTTKTNTVERHDPSSNIIDDVRLNDFPGKDTPPTLQVEICPDGHKCYNGATCTTDTKLKTHRRTVFGCDCSAIKKHGRNGERLSYAGSHCEHAATVYCVFGDDSADDGKEDEEAEYQQRHQQNNQVVRSFCVNGGKCKRSIVTAGAGTVMERVGCECPKGWEGDHCQFFFKGFDEDVPLSETNASPTKEAFSSSPHQDIRPITFFFLITLIISSLAAAIIFVRMIYRDRSRSNDEISPQYHVSETTLGPRNDYPLQELDKDDFQGEWI